MDKIKESIEVLKTIASDLTNVVYDLEKQFTDREKELKKKEGMINSELSKLKESLNIKNDVILKLTANADKQLKTKQHKHDLEWYKSAIEEELDSIEDQAPELNLDNFELFITLAFKIKTNDFDGIKKLLKKYNIKSNLAELLEEEYNLKNESK